MLPASIAAAAAPAPGCVSDQWLAASLEEDAEKMKKKASAIAAASHVAGGGLVIG